MTKKNFYDKITDKLIDTVFVIIHCCLWFGSFWLAAKIIFK